jgi:hypothetical protein
VLLEAQRFPMFVLVRISQQLVQRMHIMMFTPTDQPGTIPVIGRAIFVLKKRVGGIFLAMSEPTPGWWCYIGQSALEIRFQNRTVHQKYLSLIEFPLKSP